MSRDKKYGKIDPEDFLRYLSGEMPDRERNALEREMQKDPFAADALEGLSIEGIEEARKDLSKLEARLIRRVGGRRSVIWIRIAASAALLIALGTVYFTVFSDKPGRMDRMVAETESAEQSREKSAPEELTAPAAERDEIPVLSDERDMGPEQEITAGKVKSEAFDDRPEPSGTREQAGRDQAPEERTDETGLIREEKILLADEAVEHQDTMRFMLAETEEQDATPPFTSPVARQSGIARPTALDREQPVAMAADDITGNGTTGSARKKQAEELSVAAVPEARRVPDSIPALPVIGMDMFERYIETTLRYPEVDTIGERAVVELSFHIDSQGRPVNIIPEKSPGDAFSLEAIRLLREGPAWTRAIINGAPSEEKAHVRIEFKKDNP